MAEPNYTDLTNAYSDTGEFDPKTNPNAGRPSLWIQILRGLRDGSENQTLRHVTPEVDDAELLEMQRYRQHIEELMAQGMSPEDAKAQADIARSKRGGL